MYERYLRSLIVLYILMESRNLCSYLQFINIEMQIQSNSVNTSPTKTRTLLKRAVCII